MTKGLLTVFLCILTAGLVCATKAIPDTGVIGRTYTNEERGFQISLPDDADFADWNIIDDSGIAPVFFMGPWDASVNFQPKVNVFASALLEPQTPKEYLATSIEELRASIGDWKETSRRPIKLGSKDGYEIIYTGRLVGKNLTWIQHYLVRGQYGYVITGIDVPEKFQAQPLREIMSTFQFLPVAVKIPRGKLAATWGHIKARLQ